MNNRVHAAFAQIHADEALILNTMAFINEKRRESDRIRPSFFLPKLAGALAVMAAVAGIFIFNVYFIAVSYVSIDVNPSVELALNRVGKVVGAYAFNEDGNRIISETGLDGKRYDEAAGIIMSAMRDGGYLTDDVLVSVTVRTASGDMERLLCSSLEQAINSQVLSVHETAEIEVFPVSEQVWSDAHACHMSPAKYLAIQELLEVDDQAVAEDYSDATISQIRQHVRECRNNHESGNSSGHGHGRQYRHGH